jgi:hypothetical protein
MGDHFFYKGAAIYYTRGKTVSTKAVVIAINICMMIVNLFSGFPRNGERRYYFRLGVYVTLPPPLFSHLPGYLFHTGRCRVLSVND